MKTYRKRHKRITKITQSLFPISLIEFEIKKAKNKGIIFAKVENILNS
jgi:hypothetical protein